MFLIILYVRFSFIYRLVILWGQTFSKAPCRRILRARPPAAGSFYFLVVTIWDCRCFHFGIVGDRFGTSGAPCGTILAPRGHLGGPWEQQDGFEVADNRIWGLFMSVFESRNSSNFVFFWFGLFPGHFFIDLLNQNFGAWDFQIDRSFRRESLANIVFLWKSFLMNSGIEFCFFRQPFETVLMIFSLENTLGNPTFFVI